MVCDYTVKTLHTRAWCATHGQETRDTASTTSPTAARHQHSTPQPDIPTVSTRPDVIESCRSLDESVLHPRRVKTSRPLRANTCMTARLWLENKVSCCRFCLLYMIETWLIICYHVTRVTDRKYAELSSLL